MNGNYSFSFYQIQKPMTSSITPVRSKTIHYYNYSHYYYLIYSSYDSNDNMASALNTFIVKRLHLS